MRTRLFFLLILGLVLLSANGVRAQDKAAAAFEKLKSLVGHWEAKGPNGLPLKIDYRLEAADTALIETRVPQDEPSMITVFHLDGDHLLLTHYCSAGNQPRMRAEISGGDTKELVFNLTGVANLSKAAVGHMAKLRYFFQSRDKVTQVWTWRENGRDAPATFDLERKR